MRYLNEAIEEVEANKGGRHPLLVGHGPRDVQTDCTQRIGACNVVERRR